MSSVFDRRKILNLVILLGVAGLLFSGSAAANADHAKGHAGEATGASEGQYVIKFKTDSEPGKIVPDVELVELLIEVLDKSGKHAEDVTLSYKLYAPEQTFWFSTDFPIVEGTQLLGGSAYLPDGVQYFDMVLPIRGTYRLKADVDGPAGHSSTMVSFDVSENPSEKKNLIIFIILLLVIGAIGGFIITRSSLSGTAAAMLIWAFAGGMISCALMIPDSAYAHLQGLFDLEELEKHQGTTGQLDLYSVAIRTFPQPTEVGEMMNVAFSVEKKNAVSGLYKARVQFVHSEGGMEMVGQKLYLPRGQGQFNVQLFDGAPHYMITSIYKPDGDKGGHGSDGLPWEAANEYTLGAGMYQAVFEESGDAAMKWLLLPAATPNLEGTAKSLMEGACMELGEGNSFSSVPRCFNLKLNPKGTTFSFKVSVPGIYRLFTNHLPEEFNLVLKNSSGDTVASKRSFVPGEGELIAKDIRLIDVKGISPPLDDKLKGIITLLAIISIGFIAGSKAARLAA